jgi:putative chitinase
MSQSSFGEALLRLWPNGDVRIPALRAGIIAAAPAVFAKYGIATPLLVAHVMAQISHECGAGHDVVENMNYTAGRMMQVWPSRFATMAMAAPYAGNPRALANKVYNGRMGNVSGSDDGWTFRGRGAAQTTGREGYARLAKATGLDLVRLPDLVNDPKNFLECGVADFVLCGCLTFAKADDVLNVTRRLNGGTVGLSQRRAWLGKWKAALGSAPLVLAQAPPATTAPVIPQGPAPDAAKPDARSKPSSAPDGQVKKPFTLMAWLFGIFSATLKRK